MLSRAIKLAVISVVVYALIPLLIAGFAQMLAALLSADQRFEFPPSHHAGKTHVVWIVHGFLGNPAGNRNVAATLHEVIDADSTFVQFSLSNWGPLKTLDGVDAGGERLAAEVRQFVAERPDLEEISFICSSLGGLYTRYAVKSLYSADKGGRIAGLRPRVYLTLASPHLGAHFTWVDDHVFRAARWVVGLFSDRYGRSLDQALRTDADERMLERLTEPDYIQALGAFERRVLFANRINDNRALYESAAIWPQWRHDPAADVESEVVEVWRTEGNSLEVERAFASVATADSRLEPDQLRMARRLRVLSFDVVDTHYDGFFALSLAHIHIQGRYVDLAKPCQGLLGHVLPSDSAASFCKISGTDATEQLAHFFK